VRDDVVMMRGTFHIIVMLLSGSSLITNWAEWLLNVLCAIIVKWYEPCVGFIKLRVGANIIKWFIVILF